MTFDSNLATGTYLSGSGFGSFDISAALVGHQLVSASLSLGFYDDGDPAVFQGQSTTSYCCGGSSRLRRRTSHYLDAYEAVSVSTTGGSASASSSYFDYTTFRGTSYDGRYYWYTYYYSCGPFGWYTCSQDVYWNAFTDYFDRYYGYDGSFGVSFGLNPTGLADLADGVLSFALYASGDSRLSYARLTADLVPVPEPATVFLLGTVLAIGGVRRLTSKARH